MNRTAKIALFGTTESPQIDALEQIFQHRKIAVQSLDIRLGPTSLTAITISHNKLTWQGVNFDEIEAVYIRGTALNTWPSMPPINHLRQYHERRIQFLAEQEYQSVTFGFFESLKNKGKLVINPLTSAYLDHDSKAQQYNKLAAQGYTVPQTLTTNESEKAREFIKKHQHVIVKPMVGIGSARLVQDIDMANLDDLAYCPAMFQEQIKGETIRVHIVGNKVVLALKILTFENQIDSRTNTQGFEFYSMLAEEEDKIVSANQFMGLHYATWDIIISDQGVHYYLDCNPGGYIMWIGKLYSDFVLQQLANYMQSYSISRDINHANNSVERFKE